MERFMEWVQDSFNMNLATTVNDLTVSLEQFNPSVYALTTNIHNIILPISYSLLAVFFIIDLLGKCTNLEVMRWHNVIKSLIRLAVGKMIVTSSLYFLNSIYKVAVGIIIKASSVGSINIVENDSSYIMEAIEGMGVLERLSFQANLAPYIVILQVVKIAVFIIIYARMIEIYWRIAISPLALATIGTDSTKNIAKQFLQGYVAVCLQGLLIVISLMFYGALTQGMNAGLRPDTFWGMLRNTMISSSVLLLILTKSGTWAKQITGLGG
jgi:hypothetical protein